MAPVWARAATVLAGIWAGVLLCIGAIAAPAAFGMLAAQDAGRFVAKAFEQEAYLSVAVALVLFLVERQRSRVAAEVGTGSVFSANIVMLFGTLFCTVAGYFAVIPMMAAARAGQGSVSFGTLHAISGGMFLVKGLLVLALAWRLTGAAPVARNRIRKTAATS